MNGNAVGIVSQIANPGFEVQATTSLASTAWVLLDVVGNEPFFSASNRAPSVQDYVSPVTGKCYRLRVVAP